MKARMVTQLCQTGFASRIARDQTHPLFGRRKTSMYSRSNRSYDESVKQSENVHLVAVNFVVYGTVQPDDGDGKCCIDDDAANELAIWIIRLLHDDYPDHYLSQLDIDYAIKTDPKDGACMFGASIVLSK